MISQKDRLTRLVETIRTMDKPQGFVRYFLYYDLDTEDATLPTVAKEWDPSAREVSRNLI